MWKPTLKSMCSKTGPRPICVFSPAVWRSGTRKTWGCGLKASSSPLLICCASVWLSG